MALVANQAQTLAQVRQYVVENISPRKAKFKLHVPDSPELQLYPAMDRETLEDLGLLNRTIIVTQLPLKNKMGTQKRVPETEKEFQRDWLTVPHHRPLVFRRVHLSSCCSHH